MHLILIGLSLFVGQCWAQGIPWIGEERHDQIWLEEHKALLDLSRQHKKDLEVIFFGDSITWMWPLNGKDIWDQYYAPKHAFNYGIGGDKTENLIWRMEEGEFNGLNSKLVVLMIGTNNLVENTDEDIAHGIKEVVNQTLTRQPNASVLLLGIIPRDGILLETRVKEINSMISKLNDDKRVFYLDMSSHFETDTGVEIPDLYLLDRVHLTHKGYQVWHDVMEPLFSKLYNRNSTMQF